MRTQAQIDAAAKEISSEAYSREDGPCTNEPEYCSPESCWCRKVARAALVAADEQAEIERKA